MDGIIEVKVRGSHIWKDSSNAGTRYEENAKKLRISFDEQWGGLAKTVTFWNAKGQNPVKRTLTTDLLEDISKSTLVYLCAIPGEAMTEAGQMKFVIDGFEKDKRVRSLDARLNVDDSSRADDAQHPADPIPSMAEQLQSEIEALVGDVAKERKAAETAANSAENFKNISEQFSMRAVQSAENAEKSYGGAKTAETEAVKAAGKSEDARALAESYTNHPPVPGDNGNWMVWNGEVYVDSGKKAVGAEGVTFTPYVDEKGILHWENNGLLDNPDSVNIRGGDGFSPIINVDKIDGGHRVTVIDKNGEHSFDISNGKNGAAGVSPDIKVSKISGGHRVTIIDADGASYFDVMNGESAGGDWKQKYPDGEGFIKNRIAYKDVYGVDGEVITENVNFTTSVANTAGLMKDALEPGGKYVVRWNNQPYHCTCKESLRDGPYIGNAFLLDGSENTGEPFCIYRFTEDYYQIIKDTEPEETIFVSVYGFSVTDLKRMDDELLPEGYPYRETVKADIIPKKMITFSDGLYEYKSAVELTVGGQYIVKWDTKEYQCVGKEYVTEEMTSVCIGDVSSLTGGESTGEPFAVVMIPADMAAELGHYARIYKRSGMLSVATITVTEIKEVVHPMDKDLLPDDLGGGSGDDESATSAAESADAAQASAEAAENAAAQAQECLETVETKLANGEFDGAPGQRGTGILKVTTAPVGYTTAIGSYTPKYRIALSTVKSQSKVDEVLLGDVIQHSYYQYFVDYMDATYAYISATRTSLRGAAGTTPVKGTDYWTAADKQEIVDDVLEQMPEGGYSEDAAVHNAVGTTFPPAQKPGGADFEGYDIDIVNVMADDVFAYIDAVVGGKETVTKEIMGKDASGAYDIARYTYANREYLAWVRQNYPKMYAWKNGDIIKYTQSVSPRIDEKAYDVPYIGGSGGTNIETVTVPAKAVIYKDYRYSHSGGSFKEATGTASVIVPLPKSGITSATVEIVNAVRSGSYTGIYAGETSSAFPTDGAIASNVWNVARTIATLTPATYNLSGANFIIFFIEYTDAAALSNVSVKLNGVALNIVIGIPSDAQQESTTTTEVEGEAGIPITAVSATRRSRTIGGVEYIRYADGDVEPTVIYTDKDDDRNSGTSITKDGITYSRYPLGDLGANRTKLTPVFIYANEHGYVPNHTYEGHETKMCALVAARFLQDLAAGKQAKNPLYQYIRENCMIVVIPVANPFGYNINLTGGSGINSGDNASGYLNANRCNINRNYDTPGWDYMHENEVVNDNWYGHYPGSQNETQYIMNTMVESGAVVAMSLHSHSGGTNLGAVQGQDPDGTYFNEDGMSAISDFLEANYGYKLVDYDVSIEHEYSEVGAHNMPDVTCKSPSYITQCGAYGGIVEFSPFEHDATSKVVTYSSTVIENAYAQTINLIAMWLSDYLEA